MGFSPTPIWRKPDVRRWISVPRLPARTAPGSHSFLLVPPRRSGDFGGLRRDQSLLGRSFFVVLQRWNFNLGSLCIGAMHGFRSVSQGLLSETFRVAGCPCTFRPGITIRVERDSAHTHEPAPPSEQAAPI